MVFLGKKTSINSLIIMTLTIIGMQVLAEEPVRVQATPQVKAVNVAPMETTDNVVKLQPQTPQTIQVQATPSVQNVSSTILQQPTQEVKPPAVNVVPKTTQQVLVSSPITPVDVSFDSCSKMFPINAENLFVLTLGAVEANGFKIKELQSQGGYITFEVQNKEFLATIAEIDAKNSMLKINPTNGVYHFAPGIVMKVFEYIDFKLKK